MIQTGHGSHQQRRAVANSNVPFIYCARNAHDDDRIRDPLPYEVNDSVDRARTVLSTHNKLRQYSNAREVIDSRKNEADRRDGVDRGRV